MHLRVSPCSSSFSSAATSSPASVVAAAAPAIAAAAAVAQFDRSSRELLSTSRPTNDTTDAPSPLAATSSFLPTARRVIHPHLSWDATDLAVPLPLQPPPPTFLTDEEPAFDEAAFPLPERRGRMEQAHPPSRPHTPTPEESEYKTQQTYAKEPQQERPRQVPPLQLALSPDLKKLLASQGLSSLESSLVSEGVLSLHQLAYVSEADLERLGLNMGQRAGLRSQLAQRGFDVSKSIQSASAPATPSAEEQGAVTKSTASSRAHQRSKFSGPASSRAFSPRGASARSTGSSTGRRRQEDVGPARPRPTAKQAFYSLHEPHPSHPQSFYDYVARPPPPTAIRSTTLTRNAEIPSSPRHLSPQPSARDYLAPTPRTIQPVPALGPGHHRGEFSPNYESAPYALPMPVSARTGEMVREMAPLVSSPPLVHDADYPLHSHTHGVPPERLHEACSFEHEHPFDASSHPPHMSHPMPPPAILPHSRRPHGFDLPPRPVYLSPPSWRYMPQQRAQGGGGGGQATTAPPPPPIGTSPQVAPSPPVQLPYSSVQAAERVPEEKRSEYVGAQA